MTNNSFFQTMRDGTEVSVQRWIPDGEVKALVHLSHGMAEHAMRYDKLGSILAEAGILLSANDHRGHGKTAQRAKSEGKGDFGYLADRDGFDKVEGDLEEVILNLKADYPQKKVILLGHSFGSFAAQSLMEKNGDLVDGVILSGTSGPMRSTAFWGNKVFALNSLILGKKHKAKFDSWCVFGKYNRRVKNPKTAFDWLSRNEFNVEMYTADQWCGFTPSAEFFTELTRGLYRIHSPARMRQIPKSLPVYFVYGSDDPVGGYGKTIQRLIEIYKANGMTDVSFKEWKDDRHEVLNELDGDAVIADVLAWIQSHS